MAGTHSGVGKTTVATGLMAAWHRRGVAVAAAKVGPDFIDPGYHEVATGRPGRNLDAFLSGADALAPLAGRAAAGADLLVVEGAMGLFDGIGATADASTAHVALLLDAPVVLVVDASSMSGSVAALVHGFDDTLRRLGGRPLAGVVLNRVGSDTHTAMLADALATQLGTRAPPLVGMVRRGAVDMWRDRHLGLVPVAEQRATVAASVRALGGALGSALDLDALERIARAAPARAVADLTPLEPVAGSVRVAVAAGPAFTFAYPDNLERLREAGAVLAPFDPLEDRALPSGAQALYAGGGFPEVYAARLADNEALADDVRAKVAGGLVTWAECGGMLWLARSLGGHRLCGALPATGTMGTQISVGYRHATVRTDNPVAPRGSRLRGHELHYSRLEPPGGALELVRAGGGLPDGAPRAEGWASPTLLATYLHLHLGADGGPAARFVRTAARAAGGSAEAAPIG
ncbi:MAG: cobyrinate a,c-diamide synthase [Acidimicrobiales bacterium]